MDYANYSEFTFAPTGKNFRPTGPLNRMESDVAPRVNSVVSTGRWRNAYREEIGERRVACPGKPKAKTSWITRTDRPNEQRIVQGEQDRIASQQELTGTVVRGELICPRCRSGIDNGSSGDDSDS